MEKIFIVVSPSGPVPSARMAETAAWPQAAAMAGPGWRAGGFVMLPCAETAAAKSTVERKVYVRMVGWY